MTPEADKLSDALFDANRAVVKAHWENPNICVHAYVYGMTPLFVAVMAMAPREALECLSLMVDDCAVELIGMGDDQILQETAHRRYKIIAEGLREIAQRLSGFDEPRCEDRTLPTSGR